MKGRRSTRPGELRARKEDVEAGARRSAVQLPAKPRLPLLLPACRPQAPEGGQGGGGVAGRNGKAAARWGAIDKTTAPDQEVIYSRHARRASMPRWRSRVPDSLRLARSGVYVIGCDAAAVAPAPPPARKFFESRRCTLISRRERAGRPTVRPGVQRRGARPGVRSRRAHSDRFVGEAA